MKRLAIICIALLAVAAMAQSAAPTQPASVVREKYLSAYNRHDTDAVLALYAEDATLLTEAGVFRSRAEIRKWLQFALDQGSVLESIQPVREKSSERLAYGTGETKRRVGQEMHLGRYLIVMEQQNGEWRIIEHAAFNVHE